MPLIANTIENEPKFSKIYDGLVVSVSDPLNSGRVQVKVPELLGDALVWAQSIQQTIDSNQSQGLHIQAIPPVGQMVKVHFNGSENDCIWFGGSPKPGTVQHPDIVLIRDVQGNSVEWNRKTGEITVESVGQVTIKSSASVKISAPTIELDGKVSCKNGTSGVINPMNLAVVSSGVVTQLSS